MNKVRANRPVREDTHLGDTNTHRGDESSVPNLYLSPLTSTWGVDIEVVTLCTDNACVHAEQISQ